MCSLCKCLFALKTLVSNKCFEKAISKWNKRTSDSSPLEQEFMQIKYYWGWCHSHKNAWKLGKHAFHSENFLSSLRRSTISTLKIDFDDGFPASSTSMLSRSHSFFHWKLREKLVFPPSTRRPTKMLWEKICFPRRVSHQYHCAL